MATLLEANRLRLPTLICFPGLPTSPLHAPLAIPTPQLLSLPGNNASLTIYTRTARIPLFPSIKILCLIYIRSFAKQFYARICDIIIYFTTFTKHLVLRTLTYFNTILLLPRIKDKILLLQLFQ